MVRVWLVLHLGLLNFQKVRLWSLCYYQSFLRHIDVSVKNYSTPLSVNGFWLCFLSLKYFVTLWKLQETYRCKLCLVCRNLIEFSHCYITECTWSCHPVFIFNPWKFSFLLISFNMLWKHPDLVLPRTEPWLPRSLLVLLVVWHFPQGSGEVMWTKAWWLDMFCKGSSLQ